MTLANASVIRRICFQNLYNHKRKNKVQEIHKKSLIKNIYPKIKNNSVGLMKNPITYMHNMKIVLKFIQPLIL